MKIPIEAEQKSWKVWGDTAEKLSMIHGVYIGVDVVLHGGDCYIGDNKFGSLKELRRALKMKALL
jgi:hypothetical protein